MIITASVVSSLYAPALARAVYGVSTASPSCAVVLASVDFGAGPSSGADSAMVGQSPTSLVPASSTLFRSRADLYRLPYHVVVLEC